MNNLHEQFEHRMTMCHYGDDIYLLDEGLSMDSVMPLVAGREIMTDKIVCLLCQSGTLDLHLNYHHLLLTAEHTSLDWYASQLNITLKRLSICVKQTSGHTPTEWIDRHRLHQAIQLLHSGNQTIKEIASELGFPNQSTFGTWFKRQTSQSPRNFTATPQAAASNTNYTYIHLTSDKQ